MPSPRSAARSGDSTHWWQNTTVIGVAVAATWFFGVLAIGAVGDLTVPASRMLAIFGAAVALWVSEAIPLSATSIFVILAEILLISDEALLSLPASFEPPTYESVFATLASPILMLFLGGFVLADAAAKYGLDRNLAGVMLRPFGTLSSCSARRPHADHRVALDVRVEHRHDCSDDGRGPPGRREPRRR